MLIYVSSSPPFLISTFVIRPSTSTDASSTVLWRFKLAEQRWAFKFHLVASYFLLSCFCTFSCAPVSRKYFHCNANSRYLWKFSAWRGARKWSELHHSSLIFNYLTTGACKSQLDNCWKLQKSKLVLGVISDCKFAGELERWWRNTWPTFQPFSSSTFQPVFSPKQRVVRKAASNLKFSRDFTRDVNN